jgi:hypothetical protein
MKNSYDFSKGEALRRAVRKELISKPDAAA